MLLEPPAATSASAERLRSPDAPPSLASKTTKSGFSTCSFALSRKFHIAGDDEAGVPQRLSCVPGTSASPLPEPLPAPSPLVRVGEHGGGGGHRWHSALFSEGATAPRSRSPSSPTLPLAAPPPHALRLEPRHTVPLGHVRDLRLHQPHLRRLDKGDTSRRAPPGALGSARPRFCTPWGRAAGWADR